MFLLSLLFAANAQSCPDVYGAKEVNGSWTFYYSAEPPEGTQLIPAEALGDGCQAKWEYLSLSKGGKIVFSQDKKDQTIADEAAKLQAKEAVEAARLKRIDDAQTIEELKAILKERNH